MGTQNPSTNQTPARVIVWKVVRVILAVLGVISLVLAIIAIFDKLEDVLTYFNFKGTYSKDEKTYFSLATSIIGILFLFVAFSPAIDRFFNVMERKELKLSKDENKGGIGLEFMFFITIATVLTVIAILLSIGKLIVDTELPILGDYTEGFIIGSLVVLALVSAIVAFNETITYSLKEMKKVHWPKAKQMSEYSGQVFLFIIFFSLLFFAFDIAVESGLDGLRNLLS